MGTMEEPYTVGEVAKLMRLSPQVMVRIFENEKGVLIYHVPNPRRNWAGYRTIRIPRHVYERVKFRYVVH